MATSRPNQRAGIDPDADTDSDPEGRGRAKELPNNTLHQSGATGPDSLDTTLLQHAIARAYCPSGE